MEKFTAQVKLSHEAFIKARNEYANWRLAWIREILQNSYDALQTVDGDDRGIIWIKREGAVIEVLDNGPGMDRDTLLNVLLALGGSNKTATGKQTGGFGYAKTLLYFANQRYSIHTGNYLVEGCGPDYTFSDASDWQQGVRSRVEFEDEGTAARVMRELPAFQQNFDPQGGVKVYVDGVELECGQLTGLMDTQIDSEFGPISYVALKEGHELFSHSHQLWVRINGLPMFHLSKFTAERELEIRAVLDLDTAKYPVLETLTANRDALRSEHQSHLHRLFNRLVHEHVTMSLGTPFNMLLNYRSFDLPTVDGEVAEYASSGKRNMGESTATLPQEEAETISLPTRRYPYNFEIISHYANRSRDGIKALNFLNTKRAQVLAHTWHEVVKHVLSCEVACNYVSQYMVEDDTGRPVSDDWYDNERYGEFRVVGPNVSGAYTYRPGFIFHDNIEAINSRRDNDGVTVIAMNPQKLPSDWMTEDLVDLACHEVAHCLYSDHDVNFINFEFELRRSVRRYAKGGDIRSWLDGHLRELGLKGRQN